MIGNTFHVSRFGENLRQARNSHKLTQKNLANLLGVAERTIINWESERKTKKGVPSVPKGVDLLIKLSEVLNCDIDYFLGRIEKRRRETADICALTGLSVKAVETLMEWNSLKGYKITFFSNDNLEFLNEIIPNLDFLFTSDFNRLQELRKNPDNVFSALDEKEISDLIEKGYSAPLKNAEAKRFFVSELGKKIENILRKDFDL